MRVSLSFVLVLLFLPVVGCSGGGSGPPLAASDPFEAVFDPSLFPTGAEIDNSHFPLTCGTSRRYLSESGEEVNELFVSHQTRVVAGVECAVVLDRTFFREELVSEVFRFYAQDVSGDVWSLGEHRIDLTGDPRIPASGSWEAGVDGAKPGIVLGSRHVIGDRFPVAAVPGRLDVWATVVATDVPVVLDDGTTRACLLIRESSTLEPGRDRLRYHAEDLGLVLSESPDGISQDRLVEISSDGTPDVDPSRFVQGVDNPLFPLEPGSSRIFEGSSEEGLETIEIVVTGETKEILGVPCTVVEERKYTAGELVELTLDWYAQDVDGAVWYFGENTVVSDKDEEDDDGEESWEAGEGGAYPGIIIPKRPRVGDSHRQENVPQVGDEVGIVLRTDAEVTVPAGTFRGCLKVLERSRLDGTLQHKYYAPGVGAILETSVGGTGRMELIELR